MKTLIKLAKSNRHSRIPVLKTILVNGGKALASNLDMVIIEATEMKDGLYHAEGFEHGLKSNISPQDFPMLMDIGASVYTLPLTIDDLEYVAGAMSTEETRYYLCGVHFNGTKIEATDRHRLNQIDLSGASMPNKIIPSDAIKYAIAAAKENKVKEISISLHEKGFTIIAGATTLQGKHIDGTFPDTDRVIPKIAKHVLQFKKAEYAADMKLEKVKAKCEDRDFHAYVLKRPIRIGFNLGYLEKLMDGEMSITDASSPVKVIAGNRLSVLMPMRV